MKYVCEKNKCTGCMACVSACSNNAISIIDSGKEYNAVIDQEKCVECNLCHKVCQNNHPIKLSMPLEWLQGWSEDSGQRKVSSSGGLAFELEKDFLINKGHVWTCCFLDGEFTFIEAFSVEEIKNCSGSKYVKSNPQMAYNKIKNQLKREKVLFVGLPCQVAGIRNFVGEKEENLFTIDLICHGAPSVNVLEKFLNQYKYSLNSISRINFRNNIEANEIKKTGREKIFSMPGTCDSYILGFFEGLFLANNCYECLYAGINRISDITLGDSWGSNLSEEEKKKGISLILVQTNKGREMINNANIYVCSVDKDNAIKNNRQLSGPIKLHKNRDVFFETLKKHSFNYSVARCIPKSWLKQQVKKMLLKLRLLKKKSGAQYQICVYEDD